MEQFIISHINRFSLINCSVHLSRKSIFPDQWPFARRYSLNISAIALYAAHQFNWIIKNLLNMHQKHIFHFAGCLFNGTNRSNRELKLEMKTGHFFFCWKSGNKIQTDLSVIKLILKNIQCSLNNRWIKELIGYDFESWTVVYFEFVLFHSIE